MNKTEISVIVTAHNYGNYIVQCLDSIVNQRELGENVGLDIIVVNDGSTDNTATLLAEYSGKTNVNVLTTNKIGLAAAGNLAISQSQSEWIMRLDADDWLEGNAISKLLKKAANSDAELISSDLCLVDKHGRKIGVLSQSPDFIGTSMERSPAGSGLLYKRKAWEVVGGYNENLRYQEDFDFWLKLTGMCTLSHVDEPLYNYRQHYSSMSGNRIERAKVRAQVKHEAMQKRISSNDINVDVIICTIPPLYTKINPEILVSARYGETLLDSLFKKIKNIRYGNDIYVVSSEQEIDLWASKKNLSVITGKASYNMESICSSYRKYNDVGASNIKLFVSPYFPHVASYRFTEIIDTLLLGDYGNVATTIADSSIQFLPGQGAWSLSNPVNHLAALPGAMKESGGLIGVNKLMEEKWGCVEIFSDESFLVSDESALSLYKKN